VLSGTATRRRDTPTDPAQTPAAQSAPAAVPDAAAGTSTSDPRPQTCDAQTCDAQTHDVQTSDAQTRAAQTRGAGDHPWRRAAWSAFAVWSAAIVSHVAAALYYWSATERPPPHLEHVPLWLNRWDSEHYLRIATEGYGYWEGAPAFFPLYPLTVRGVDAVLPIGTLACGLLVAAGCAYGALVLLHRLAEFELGVDVARRATFYLAALPASFFLFLAYNESMFVMLSLATLYACRRGHWWLAGALAGLASATRMFGILLALPLAIEYLRQRGLRGVRADVLALALVPTGLGAYAFYCWSEFGNPLQFSAAQAVWRRDYVLPGQALWDAAKTLDNDRAVAPMVLSSALDLLSLTLAIVLVGLALVGPWRLRRDQFYLVAHGALGVLLLASMEIHWGNPLQSAPRLVLETVPMFLVLARMGANQLVDRLVLTVGISLQGVLLLVFMSQRNFVA
jgi:hypothetical protein